MGKYTLALLAFFLVLSLSVEGWAGPPEPADTRTIERWAATLVAFGAGNPIFPGIRQAGTPADDQATQWLADMFQKFGLEQVRREPVPMAGWQPTAYGLTVHTNQGDVKLDAWPIFYARFLESGRVTAPLVYMGESPKGDMAGKIVVADLRSPLSIALDSVRAAAYETYDPDRTFKPGERLRFWAFSNQEAYDVAALAKAAAFIGVHMDKADRSRFFQNAGGVKADPLGEWFPTFGALPGLYVNRPTGEALRAYAKAGARATLVSEGATPPTQTYNVVGVLPGLSSKIIQIQSHSDGGAANDASGAAAVLALAEYYSRVPAADRKKTLQFVISAGHFSTSVGFRTFIKSHREDIQKNVLVNLTVEHVGRHYELEDGKLMDRGMACPSFFYSTNKDWFPLMSEAVHRYDLKRTFVLPHSGPGNGEGALWNWRSGRPSIYNIAPVEYMQSTEDTLEKIDLERVRAITQVYVRLIDRLSDLLDWSALRLPSCQKN